MVPEGALKSASNDLCYEAIKGGINQLAARCTCWQRCAIDGLLRGGGHVGAHERAVAGRWTAAVLGSARSTSWPRCQGWGPGTWVGKG